MTDEDGLADVVQLRPVERAEYEDDMPVRDKPDQDRCFRHGWQSELDEKKERAYCSECGDEVPLFEVLKHIASQPERYVATRKRARSDAKAALAELEDVQRQVKNAKAQRRRWRVKADEDWLNAVQERAAEVEDRFKDTYRMPMDDDAVVVALAHPAKYDIRVTRKR